MNHQRSNPMPAPSNGRFRMRCGFAVAALILANVTGAAADANGPKGQGANTESSTKGAPRASQAAASSDAHAGPGAKGHGQTKGPNQAAAGAAEIDSRFPAGFPDVLKKKFEVLVQKEAEGALTEEDKPRLARLRQIKHNFQKREDRTARFTLLKQRETDGKLTAEEKPELEAEKQRQARFENLRTQNNDRNPSRPQRSREAKRRALKEFPGLHNDSAAKAEYAKHAERIAKIERAKDVAGAEQDANTVARLDKVLVRETQRHKAWLAKRRPAAIGASQGANP